MPDDELENVIPFPGLKGEPPTKSEVFGICQRQLASAIEIMRANGADNGQIIRILRTR